MNFGGDDVQHQVIAIILSILAFLVMAESPWPYGESGNGGCWGLRRLGIFVALVIPPIPAYPQHRWIWFGGSFSLQSVEVLKFALLISVSGFLATRVQQGMIGNYRLTLKPLALAVGVIGIIVVFIQSDLGSAGVIVAMVMLMGLLQECP